MKKEKKPKEPKIITRKYFEKEEWSKDNTFIGTYRDYLIERKKRVIERKLKKKEQGEKEKEEYRKNIIGKKFNRLTVIEVMDEKKNGETLWRCGCDCGNEYIGKARYIKYGSAKSCGCISKEIIANSISHKRIYKIWHSMIERCYNPNNSAYKDYGGREIEVCKEWRKSARNFIDWAYDNGYDENAKRGECTIDRIDVNGNYEPNNCRWVDMKIQANNKRPRIPKRIYEIEGQKVSLKEIKEKYNISRRIIIL